MTLRIGIVGTGRVAQQSYIPALVKHEDVELIYYNRTRSKAEAVAEQFGGEVVGSPEELMARDPDAVLVLTFETDRYAAASALLELKPRRIFFEKPLVAQQGQANVVEDDFAKGRELLRRAAEVGAETAMVFNYRFFDQTVKARGIVEGRGFGAPVHVTGLVNYACWSHCIDLALWFAGPVQELTALRSRQLRGQGDEAAADVTVAFRTEGDATGTLIGTQGIDLGVPLYELTLAYEHGRVSMRDLDGDMEAIDYRTRRHELHSLSRDVSRWNQYSASFAKSLDAYLATVRAGTPPPIPGLAGLRELQFEAAIKRSIAEGRAVSLPEELPLET